MLPWSNGVTTDPPFSFTSKFNVTQSPKIGLSSEALNNKALEGDKRCLRLILVNERQDLTSSKRETIRLTLIKKYDEQQYI